MKYLLITALAALTLHSQAQTTASADSAKKAQEEMNRRKQDEAFHKDWANTQRYATANQQAETTGPKPHSVVYMGDSITDFWMVRDSAFFASNPYYDRGISGQTTTSNAGALPPGCNQSKASRGRDFGGHQ